MRRSWWTLVAVCSGVFMLLLDVTIVNVALPQIQRVFSASLSDLQWVIDAYALVLAALLLTAGSLADRLGRRRLFLVGITVFTVASLLCGASTGWLMLAVCRALQGVGGAIMFATSLALLSSAFPPARRGTAFGIFGAVTGGAVALGPVLGGVLTEWASWRWIFFVNLPIGVFALLVTVREVAESRDPEPKPLDLPGFATFSVALAALVFGLIRGEPDGWSSATVVSSLTAAGVLLLAFLITEARSAAPMFDLRLLRVPTFGGGLIAAWAVSASIFSLLTYLLLYLQNVLGYTPLQSGLRILPLSGAVFFAAGLAGRLVDRVPTRWLIGAGFLLVGVGLLLMRGVEPGQSWTHFLPGFVVAGAGAGFINVPLVSTAVGVVGPHEAGMASGVNSTFRQIGIATGVVVLGSLFTSRFTDALGTALAGTPLAARSGAIAAGVTSGGGSDPAAAAAGRAAFASALNDITLVAAVIALIAAVLSVLLIRRRDFVTAPTLDDDVLPERALAL
jgi:EmrB/QacA subfamily drug resistance transporter